jgi:CHAD domain-containing protein
MATDANMLALHGGEHSGLSHWMKRALKECQHARSGFDAEAVHDLRVALRRCRSMADGLRATDHSPAWKKMKKAGRKLFRALGELRDTQVTMEWARKLAPAEDPVRARLLVCLAERELDARSGAEDALDRFDRKQWRHWAEELPRRARRIPRDGLVFQHLALEQWTEAKQLHQRARRRRSQAAYHQLRIGIKRFRYTIENFLPRRHEEWGADLKRIQDLLGDIHDLDVLRAMLRRGGVAPDAQERARWTEWIEAERGRRLTDYHARMSGENSLFSTWRAALPEGKRLEQAAFAKLAAWAGFLDPDFNHSRHVAALALNLFDGFAAAGLNGVFREARSRRLLQGAALLHEVGRSECDAGHHKASYRLIRDFPPPLGWTREEMSWMALVARYHRGAEPRDDHEGFAAFSPAEQQSIVWLSALLRLADAFDAHHDRRVTGLGVEVAREGVIVRGRGYLNDLISAGHVAGRKHLLESICAKPVIVRSDDMDMVVPVLDSLAS